MRPKITKFVLDLFFPVFCLACQKEGRYLCERCTGFVGEASFICPVCETSTFTGETHEACKGRYTLDGLIGVWEYEGVIKQLLLRIKYGGVAHAAQETIELAFRTATKDTARFSPFLSFLLAQDTALTFVPMWKRKERKRGYNQAALMAKEIAVISAHSVASLLQKTKDTKAQTELGKEERLQNVRGTFRFNAQYSNPNTEKIPNFLMPKNVVLVDDVWTTGATMKECCKVLKKAGVEQVWGFTLARTV
ncbi:MAG: ComF family protein [Candidatus Portnoybacteria bacterium]|nr:ComF family protein [Candidatus Portnoybacteria bacterium]